MLTVEYCKETQQISQSAIELHRESGDDTQERGDERGSKPVVPCAYNDNHDCASMTARLSGSCVVRPRESNYGDGYRCRKAFVVSRNDAEDDDDD